MIHRANCPDQRRPAQSASRSSATSSTRAAYSRSPVRTRGRRAGETWWRARGAGRRHATTHPRLCVSACVRSSSQKRRERRPRGERPLHPHPWNFPGARACNFPCSAGPGPKNWAGSASRLPKRSRMPLERYYEPGSRRRRFRPRMRPSGWREIPQRRWLTTESYATTAPA